MDLAIQCIALEINSFVQPEVARGNILPISTAEIADSLFGGGGLYADVHGTAVSYLRLVDMGAYKKITTMATDPSATGMGLASYLVRTAIAHNEGKPVVAVANKSSLYIFRSLDFKALDRENVPEELWGGRTKKEWKTCDRTVMLLGKNPFAP